MGDSSRIPRGVGTDAMPDPPMPDSVVMPFTSSELEKFIKGRPTREDAWDILVGGHPLPSCAPFEIKIRSRDHKQRCADDSTLERVNLFLEPLVMLTTFEGKSDKSFWSLSVWLHPQTGDRLDLALEWLQMAWLVLLSFSNNLRKGELIRLDRMFLTAMAETVDRKTVPRDWIAILNDIKTTTARVRQLEVGNHEKVSILRQYAEKGPRKLGTSITTILYGAVGIWRRSCVDGSDEATFVDGLMTMVFCGLTLEDDSQLFTGLSVPPKS